MDEEIIPGSETPPAEKPAEGAPATKEEPNVDISPLPDVEGLEAGPVTYDETGDAALDAALEFVGNLGFGPAHPALKAAESGDFGPLREALGKLGDKAKGFAKYLKMGEQAFARTAGDKKAASEKLGAEIAEAAGGAEVWAQVRAWATENASPEEKAEVNKALAMGGKIAKQMAKALHEAWSGTAPKEPGKARKPDSTGKAAPDAPLKALDYANAVAALSKKYRGDLEGDGAAEYRVLQQRREAARRAGR